MLKVTELKAPRKFPEENYSPSTKIVGFLQDNLMVALTSLVPVMSGQKPRQCATTLSSTASPSRIFLVLCKIFSIPINSFQPQAHPRGRNEQSRDQYTGRSYHGGLWRTLLRDRLINNNNSLLEDELEIIIPAQTRLQVMVCFVSTRSRVCSLSLSTFVPYEGQNRAGY